MKKILSIILILFTTTSVTSCNKDSNAIIVATMPHLSEPIIRYASNEFYELTGKNLQARNFLEFDPINHALSEGSVHANLFQHRLFLEQFNNTNNTDLVYVEKLYTPRFTAWSFRVDSKEYIPNNARVVIQNDASNRSRALVLLESMGLIRLDNTITNRFFTRSDIVYNPRNLRIQEMTSAIIPIALRDDDVYIGIIGAVFAIPANLHLVAYDLYHEGSINYERNVNVLVVRKEDYLEEPKWLDYLRQVLTSETTINFIRKYFGGTVIPTVDFPNNTNNYA